MSHGTSSSNVSAAGPTVATTLPSVCETAVYPYLPAECLHSSDGRTVEDVRWVTTETRVAGENASALTTTPVLIN